MRIKSGLQFKINLWLHFRKTLNNRFHNSNLKSDLFLIRLKKFVFFFCLLTPFSKKGSYTIFFISFPKAEPVLK